MKTLVTGAAGLIGSAVVRELLKDGQAVKAMAHSRDNRNLQGLDVEMVKGDLLDPDSLHRALEGCDRLYHVASIYAHWHPKGGDFIRRVNIEGTRNMMEAAARRDLLRIIHTSSISAVGFFPDRPSNEDDYPREEDLKRQPYRESKYRSELIAREWSKKLPVVIVNPSSPIGVGDWAPTPTGRTILDFLNGKMFAYVDVGINVIDVDDLARGFVLAEKKGKVGERYILGNHNLYLKDFFMAIAQMTGLKPPRVKMPKLVVRLVAEVNEAIANVTKKEPLAAVEQAMHLRYKEFADLTKATAELGLPRNDFHIAIRKAVKYYLDTGAVKPERAKLVNLEPSAD
jgi:dihydroflavonol-4-reductase